MDEAVTLDDVARVAGVSRAAASRSLNGKDGVRPDVRERVKRIADSLGYQPNRAARQLASGRSWTIGLVIPSRELRTEPYAASLIDAVTRAAAAADLGVMLFLGTDEPREKVWTNLSDGSIDGAVISAMAAGAPWIEDLLDRALPSVLVGSHPGRTDVPVIDVENRASSRKVVEHLFDQDCRRVGIITGPMDRVDAAERLAGYRDAHRARGREVDESLIVTGDFLRRSGREAARQLIDRLVDGVFASNDEMAAGAMAAFQEAGIEVPSDIAVAGFDATALALDHPDGIGTGIGADNGQNIGRDNGQDGAVRPITTMRQPFADLGRAAVAALQALVDGADPDTLHRTFEPEFLVGPSSRRPRPDPTAPD